MATNPDNCTSKDFPEFSLLQRLDPEKVSKELQAWYNASDHDVALFGEFIGDAIETTYELRGLWTNDGEASDYFNAINSACRILGTINNRRLGDCYFSEESNQNKSSHCRELLTFFRTKSKLYDELVTVLESINPPWNIDGINGIFFYFINHRTGLKEEYVEKLQVIQNQNNKHKKK